MCLARNHKPISSQKETLSMHYLTYLIFRAAVALTRPVPFWVLHRLSDGIFYLLYYGLRYRLRVVRGNITSTLTDLTTGEQRRVERRFYRHFCDLLLESLKGLNMTEAQLMARFEIETDLLQHYSYEGKSIIAVLGHMGNWEWGALSIGLSSSTDILAVYKPIQNRYIDRWIKSRRHGAGITLIPMRHASRAVIQRRDTPTFFGLVADQRPTGGKPAYVVDFLGRKTAAFIGAERLAMGLQYPMVYATIYKKGRSRYALRAQEIQEPPHELPPGELTQRYFRMLEASIREQPHCWLWTHKRWKGIDERLAQRSVDGVYSNRH